MGKRAKIIAEIERQIARLEDRPGLCLYYAHHTAAVLWRHNLPAVIQAGSLQWPRVRREEDDGQLDTHFAYMWTPTAPESALSVALGNLPEMHVMGRHSGQPRDRGLHDAPFAVGGGGPRYGLDGGRSAALLVVPSGQHAGLGSLSSQS